MGDRHRVHVNTYLFNDLNYFIFLLFDVRMFLFVFSHLEKNYIIFIIGTYKTSFHSLTLQLLVFIIYKKQGICMEIIYD